MPLSAVRGLKWPAPDIKDKSDGGIMKSNHSYKLDRSHNVNYRS